MNTGIIYKATNKINKKSYIGKTTRSLEERKTDHYYSIKRYENYNIHFYNALNKYGFDNFIWEVLAEVRYKKLNELESYLIWKYDTLNNGYNSTTGGDGIIKPRKEVIEKIRESMLGKIVPEERKKRISESLKQYHI